MFCLNCHRLILTHHRTLQPISKAVSVLLYQVYWGIPSRLQRHLLRRLAIPPLLLLPPQRLLPQLAPPLLRRFLVLRPLLTHPLHPPLPLVPPPLPPPRLPSVYRLAMLRLQRLPRRPPRRRLPRLPTMIAITSPPRASPGTQSSSWSLLVLPSALPP